MRMRTLGSLLVMLSLLQGCASTPPAGGSGASATSGVQLFDVDAKARFNIYLSCASRTVNCVTIEREFEAWGDTHHLTVHTVQRDDAVFAIGKPSPSADQTQPYRLAVRYSPEMASPPNPVRGGTDLPIVSYTATLQIFDAATGQLLKSRSFHAEKVADQGEGEANPYLKAQVRAFLSHVDPDYAKG